MPCRKLWAGSSCLRSSFLTLSLSKCIFLLLVDWLWGNLLNLFNLGCHFSNSFFPQCAKSLFNDSFRGLYMIHISHLLIICIHILAFLPQTHLFNTHPAVLSASLHCQHHLPRHGPFQQQLRCSCVHSLLCLKITNLVKSHIGGSWWHQWGVMNGILQQKEARNKWARARYMRKSISGLQVTR